VIAALLSALFVLFASWADTPADVPPPVPPHASIEDERAADMGDHRAAIAHVDVPRAATVGESPTTPHPAPPAAGPRPKEFPLAPPASVDAPLIGCPDGTVVEVPASVVDIAETAALCADHWPAP
jgi:hypothetical protein